MRIILRPIDSLLRHVPVYRKWRKYNRELNYWKRELEHLKRWWNGKDNFWGVESVEESTRILANKSKHFSKYQDITNAFILLNMKRKHYREHLQINNLQGKVLEVGCGPIPGTLQFASCDRYGIDPLINDYIKIGWPLYEYAMTFVNGYAEDMPFPDNYFDAVISVNSLDHVDNFGKTAQEIQRVLKPNGKLYLEIESHKPRPCEPQRIDAGTVLTSFNKCTMVLKKERTKRELFRDIENKFNLKQILPYDSFKDDEVVRLWWGTKIG